MHRLLRFFGLLALIMLACMSTTPPPAEVVEPTASATAFPSATVSPELFRDDFEGSLAAGWQWLGEDPTHWS